MGSKSSGLMKWSIFIHSLTRPLTVNGFSCRHSSPHPVISGLFYSSHTETFLPQTLLSPIKLALWIHNTWDSGNSGKKMSIQNTFSKQSITAWENYSKITATAFKVKLKAGVKTLMGYQRKASTNSFITNIGFVQTGRRKKILLHLTQTCLVVFF